MKNPGRRQADLDLAERVGELETRCGRMHEQLALINDRPLDITKMMFTPRIVLSICVIAFAVGAGQWAAATVSTYGLRDAVTKTQSDVRDILTKMEKQSELDTLKTKIEDERNKSTLLQQVQLADKVNGMDKQINEIANTVKRGR